MTFFDPKVLHSWIPSQSLSISPFFDALNNSLPSFQDNNSEQKLLSNYLSLIDAASSPKMSSALRKWVEQVLHIASEKASEGISRRLNPKILSDALGAANAELVLSRGYQLALSLAKLHKGSLNPHDNPFFTSLKQIREQNRSTITTDDLKHLTFNPHTISQPFHDQLVQTEKYQFMQKVALATAGAFVAIGSIWYLYNYYMSDTDFETETPVSSERTETILNSEASKTLVSDQGITEKAQTAVANTFGNFKEKVSEAFDVFKNDKNPATPVALLHK